MKKNLTQKYVLTMITSLIVVTFFGAFSNTYATECNSANQTMTFIENVLPLDVSKYNVTLVHHSIDDGPPIVGITGDPINRTIESLRYTLDSQESTLRITFQVQNNAVFSCSIYENEGQIIKDRTYNNLTDATKQFLEKYQTYTKEDLSDLINVIDDLDVTKNFTTTIANNKLFISNIYAYEIEQTSIKWTYIEKGAEYTSLQICFQNGNLHSILDNHQVFTIGDTSINISSEQAIKIALDYLPSYAYEMADNTWVSNFNVTEAKITTELSTASINYPEMRPYWYTKLPLNQTYPGSVKSIVTYIWANSGELFYCGTLATGGVDYTEDGAETETTPTTEIETAQPENNSITLDTTYVVGLAVAVIGIATVSAVILKKRKK